MKKLDKVRAEQMFELKKKSPGAAAGLSLLIVGAGQVYAGETGRGIIVFLVCVALWFVFLGWIMWIIAPIDAYQITKKQNKILRMELGLE